MNDVLYFSWLTEEIFFAYSQTHAILGRRMLCQNGCCMEVQWFAGQN